MAKEQQENSPSNASDQPKINNSPKNKSNVTKSPKSFFYNSTIDQVSAGTIAALTSTVILHPLDLIKIRLQVESQSSGSVWGRSLRAFRGALDGNNSGDSGSKPTSNLKTKLRRLKNLYIGLSPNIAGNCISWGMYFGWYNWIKGQMSTNRLFNSSANVPSSHSSNKQGVSFLSAKQHLIASSTAGILTQLVANPVWVVKVRMCQPQIPGSSQVRYTGVLDGLIKLARDEGLRGYYKGLTAGIIGVSHGALQFMAYEEMKKYLAINKYSGSDNQTFGTAEYLFMSVTSKLFASVATYPYQVLRTRMQSTDSNKYNRLVATTKLIYRNEGIQGFYKGLGPNIIRVMPGTMITFLVYEKSSSYFRSHA